MVTVWHHRPRRGRPEGDLVDHRYERAEIVPVSEYSKVGCALATREPLCNGCRVPEENLLGERGPRLRPGPADLTEGGWR